MQEIAASTAKCKRISDTSGHWSSMPIADCCVSLATKVLLTVSVMLRSHRMRCVALRHRAVALPYPLQSIAVTRRDARRCIHISHRMRNNFLHYTACRMRHRTTTSYLHPDCLCPLFLSDFCFLVPFPLFVCDFFRSVSVLAETSASAIEQRRDVALTSHVVQTQGQDSSVRR